MKKDTSKERDLTKEHLGRLERRAELLRERIAARGGPNAETTSETGELASLEAAMEALDASRWRRAIDEPIPPSVTDIVAAIAGDQNVTMILQRQRDGWECRCGCGRVVAEDRVYRWRPLIAAGRPGNDEGPIVGLGSYRGRRRLAIIDDRTRYLAARAKELKEKGSPAGYEKDELEALQWIRELALRDAALKRQ